jgi:alpha-amylase/alpha-mannosidase (GH57 family)
VSAEKRLKVVLCWHMHQPQYQDQATREFALPWTYLHAIKDYVDMVAHLERVPSARAVVNFAPVLLEQIDDYAREIPAHLEHGAPLSDPLLRALAADEPPKDAATRLRLIRDCIKANETRVIQRFPNYQRLVTIGSWLLEHPESLIYADNQFFADLVCWYHLAWMAESVRGTDARVATLTNKGCGFDATDRRQLLQVIGDLLAGVIGRYRRLAESGQIELSVTPYGHPIVPLLIDLDSAREAMPNAPLPEEGPYPGGYERARWHVERALEVFERHFGHRPAGCWPSEGGVSEDSLRLLESFGLRWSASGESVLRNSLQRSFTDKADEIGCIHRPYRLRGGQLACFFRDDGLSDLIGFTYSNWHADDAVSNLLHHLDNIAAACRDLENNVATIILDGENAWEYYPENGYYFLDALYRGLADHPGIELTTFSDYLDGHRIKTELKHLVAGSWVYGSFSTWIGEKDKNRGWEMLIDAKRAFDQAVADGRLDGERLEAATRQLAICEGSDWFWWFGDYNDPGSVADFERLYRRHLSNLYRILEVEAPAYLEHAFTFGGGTPEVGGTMRRGQEVT